MPKIWDEAASALTDVYLDVRMNNRRDGVVDEVDDAVEEGLGFVLALFENLVERERLARRVENGYVNREVLRRWRDADEALARAREKRAARRGRTERAELVGEKAAA